MIGLLSYILLHLVLEYFDDGLVVSDFWRLLLVVLALLNHTEIGLLDYDLFAIDHINSTFVFLH